MANQTSQASVPSTQPAPIDSGTFREVLGHFPTGVVVVTALDPVGDPVGMVIGSFTSVSLDPPLVAYLPAKTSRTFARMAESDSFCVNVLAAGQESLCREFGAPGTDPFASLSWRPAPSGAPILEGVVAWIDCHRDRVVDGGDHHVVFGRVDALAVETPVLPLLFFQGGFGRFTPQSMVISSVPHLWEASRLADRFGPHLEELARDLRAECSLMVADGTDAVFVAGANHSCDTGWTRLGARFPLAAPLGPLLIGEGSAVSEAEWLRGRGRSDAEALARAERQLAAVRRRGWSLLLRSPDGADAFEDAVAAYSTEERTPSQERYLTSVAQRYALLHEPDDLDPETPYDVHQISVPVTDGQGRTIGALRLSALPGGVTPAQIEAWVDLLRAVAARA